MLTKVVFLKRSRSLGIEKKGLWGDLIWGEWKLWYNLHWNSNLLIIWFSILQLRTINIQRKVKRRNQALMCPPKSGKSYTMKEDHYWQHNTFSMHETSPFFLVTCWQVSGERKKKNGTESDVSIDNESYDWTSWPYDLDSMVMFSRLLNRSSRRRSTILWEWHLSR